ncbi:alpha/beta hydrolase family protein [Poriferisphaera sp. WC338]|uniref:alpha/beta hydrolase family protein n=1 Tax=Poriferisphaera sp. WC338 TaxID=3425129 RepID=UPI003D81799C
MKQQSFELDHNGLTIRGTQYLPNQAENGNRVPTILFCHGFTGNRFESGFLFVRLARFLTQHGYASITFDFLHSGESDGAFEKMLPSGEIADARRMTEYLKGLTFVDLSRVALLGFSLGGFVSAATVSHTNLYKSLILLAPANSKKYRHHAQTNGSTSSTTHGPFKLHPEYYNDITGIDTLSLITQNPRPTLIIQGSNDEAVTPAASGEYREALTAAGIPNTYTLIQDADHGFNHPDWRTQLHDHVLSHLQQTL